MPNVKKRTKQCRDLAQLRWPRSSENRPDLVNETQKESSNQMEVGSNNKGIGDRVEQTDRILEMS
jgi:hypothetical protein